MRRHRLLFAMLIVTPGVALAGQWGVTAEVGLSRFGGTSSDTAAASDPISLRPSAARTFGLRLDRRFGRVAVGFAVLRAKTGVTAENDVVLTTAKDELALLEIAAEVSLRVATNAVGTTLHLHAGPVLDVWSPAGDETRTRGGAHGAISVAFPLWARFAGSLRASGAVTGSMIDAHEPPPEFERRATRRGGVSVGLRYRL